MGEELERRYVTNQAIDLMARMAKAYALSGLFDDASGELQAFVKISAGRELGLLPFESMSGISIIAGKPVVGAGILAGLVKAHPKYDYRILSHTEEECTIVFFEEGVEIGTSTFTMDDARRAGLASKKVWQQYPKNMVFSRAMSNGVAFHTPDVTNGRLYVGHEVEEEPSQTRKREAAAQETIPAADPNVIDVEPEMDTAVKEPMTGTASATKIPLTDDPDGPSHTFDPSVDPLLSVEAVEALAEREAIAAAQREAANVSDPTPEDVAEVRQMADAMHSAREAEVAAQEQEPITGTMAETMAKDLDEPPFGENIEHNRGLDDDAKVAAIGRLFNPNDPNALPTDIRLKVKKACEILEIWDKNTPTALFLLFGDAAMTSKGLQEGLAKALDEQKARKDAEKAAGAEKPVQEPETGLSSVAAALKAQDAKIQQVLGVLNGLTSDQAAALSDALDAQGQPSGATPETMAKELWLGYGPAALSADTLLAALDQPPWASGPA